MLVLIASCRQAEKKSSDTNSVNTVFTEFVNTGNVDFTKYFTDKTMRLDYFHSGTATEEHFATTGLFRMVSGAEAKRH